MRANVWRAEAQVVETRPTTIEEAGVRGYETNSWGGIIGPARLPREVVNRLGTEIRAALKVPAVVERYRQLDSEIDGSTPEELVSCLAGSLAPRITGRHPLIFACQCSADRVVKAIVGLGRDALAEMADSQNDTEATCDFCGKRYYFSPTAIREILESAS